MHRRCQNKAGLRQTPKFPRDKAMGRKRDNVRFRQIERLDLRLRGPFLEVNSLLTSPEASGYCLQLIRRLRQCWHPAECIGVGLISLAKDRNNRDPATVRRITLQDRVPKAGKRVRTRPRLLRQNAQRP